jgi:hypothetical protein
MNHLRYQIGKDWTSRMKAGADDLADMRRHRGYGYLMDMLDAELRSIWRAWMHVDTDHNKAEAMRQRAIWLSDFIRSIDEKMSEKAWMDEQERIFNASYTDEQLATEIAKAAGGPPDTGIYP